MRVWVEADVCSPAIKRILFRAADRAHVVVTFVSRSPLRVPSSPFIATAHAPKGVERPDDRIVRELQPGDLAITADVRLAAAAIAGGARALDPGGELYARDAMPERLAVQGLVDALRSGGHRTGGAPAVRERDEHVFAGQLDRLLARAREA